MIAVKGSDISKRAVLCMPHGGALMVEIRSEIERVWGA